MEYSDFVDGETESVPGGTLDYDYSSAQYGNAGGYDITPKGLTAANYDLGADMVAKAESKELVEKGFLTSSCCPAFVSYIKKSFPTLVEYISHNLSPMGAIAK